MQACSAISGVCVPLYDSLGPDAVEYILKHSDMQGVFVAAPCLARLVQAIGRERGHVLNFVCCWGAPPEEQLAEV
jgi:long-chain acyl-CoA synthetase